MDFQSSRDPDTNVPVGNLKTIHFWTQPEIRCFFSPCLLHSLRLSTPLAHPRNNEDPWGKGLRLTCPVTRATRGYIASSRSVGSEPRGTLGPETVRAQGVSYLGDTETGRW